MPTFEKSSSLPADRQRLWDWHAGPAALQRLEPPFAPATVLQAQPLAPGSRTVLRVKAPWPRKWVAMHPTVEPPERFVDTQMHGPMRRWRHEHRFEIVDADTTRLTDAIDYTPPGGPLSAVVDALAVRPMLRQMFHFRHRLLHDDLQLQQAHPSAPLTVAVSGASGLVGGHLVPLLRSAGHHVKRLVRRAEQAVDADHVLWDLDAGQVERAKLDGIDAVVHLAGENLFGRWTEGKKRRIWSSRVDGTQLLAESLASLDRPPGVLVSASAIGVYGDRGDDRLAEDARAGDGFLARLTVAWERATEPASAAGVRVVLPRISVVLDPRGGALKLMLPAFKFGLGGWVGSGTQWMPWITLEDLTALIYRCVVDSEARGPLNAAAPEQVTNKQLSRTLGKVLRRPVVLPAPAFALRAVAGELADEALLSSARVEPEAAQALGYAYRHPTLEPALRALLGKVRLGDEGDR
jgi:uncharacterized protein (TIGR01777 family)